VFVAFGIQHAKCMRRIVMSPIRLYHIFATLSHKGAIFGEKFIEQKTCVLIFSTNFVWKI